MAKALRLYAVSDSEFDDTQVPSLTVFQEDPAQPEPDVGGMMHRLRGLIRARSVGKSATSARQHKAVGSPSIRRRMTTIALTVLLTLAVSIGTAEILSAIPRFFFGWQGRHVDSYPVPALPPRIEGVDSALTLPNTTVQLFWMSHGSQQATADQTANGRLPAVSAAVMPPEYQIATFQVLLSRTHKDADADTNLKLWIQVPTPMMVVGATLMKDPVHEGEPQDALNSLDKDNGGSAVKVPSLDDGDVLYQFRVEARPDRTNNGYLCGYNAKFVQVMVRSEDKTNTSQDGVVTPYPLYVPRGEGC